ncbi:MAG: Trk system potassium transporter TrkA [Bacteroidaceae bacterium]|nr:Trk system potassium transporter TrkA [Bacteroidaceae bacterium]MBQ5775414.1 Trk system potassium transporter TrkA [Bacteroidaceae bacterium]MBR5002625.1 Trk system potassium transporter TrkA [Bacteroidaceae bacterium]
MRIVIAGAGEVGIHLAKMLSREELDVILVDSNEDVLSEIENNYNLSAIAGSPTSFNTLKRAGINEADLFLAVTPYETRNIVACTIASSLGAKKTVARIDNFEYLNEESRKHFKTMGVDDLIYPEKLACEEVIAAMRHTWARSWFELHDGALILVAVKLRDSASILNRKLYELTSTSNLFHIAAIKRHNHTIIPRGNDEVLLGDIVYFTTTPEYVEGIRMLCGKQQVDVKNIIILGGSRIAIRISNMVGDDVKIKLIEKDRDKSYRLVEKMRNTTIIQGDARDEELLSEVGISDTDMFIALSDSSETNILACLTAKQMGVPRTVAEVEDIQYITVAENLNIGTVINKKLIAASHIFQLLLDSDSSNAKCLALADAEVVELVAKPGSKITRRPVKELNLPADITLGGVIHNGVGTIVSGNTQIEANDHVLVFCLDTALSKLDRWFG